MKYRLGEIIRCGGFVTAEKFLLHQNLREIERRLGYHSGRLMHGAYFLHFALTPTLQDMSFEPVGYSTVAGHQFKFPLDLDKKKLKENIINYWGSENLQLVKVIPVIAHNNDIHNDVQYPPGSGVPQWKFTKQYPAKITAIYDREDYIKQTPYKGKYFHTLKTI